MENVRPRNRCFREETTITAEEAVEKAFDCFVKYQREAKERFPKYEEERCMEEGN